MIGLCSLCQSFRSGQEDYLNDKDILKIVSYGIDVALDLGNLRMGGDATRITRHGVSVRRHLDQFSPSRGSAGILGSHGRGGCYGIYAAYCDR